ncbi:hypothetical protein V6N12_058219 [Hibiscus sabdariffa]|uniref:Zinc finger, CCHC-type n=1 Tax=Hibiscus sabdariffa TaxID=183260 RepID=A0ABR2ERZ0_9ROSI
MANNSISLRSLLEKEKLNGINFLDWFRNLRIVLKQEKNSSGAHVIKMMGYIQTLEKLGFSLKDELATDLILQSLPDSFKPFVLNFNMNEINKTLPQLLGMLRTAKGDMKKGGSKSILVVREAKRKEKKVAKSKGNGRT